METTYLNKGVYKIKKVLSNHYVELDKNQKSKLDNIMKNLDYNQFLLKDLAKILEVVAISSYQLGAKRQKDATLENVYQAIKELEAK